MGFMGRRTKVREYDTFTQTTRLVAARDDRSRAGKVRNEKDLKRLVNAASPGVVASKVKELDLIRYKADGSLEVQNAKVQGEAAIIKQEVLAARFYPQSEQEKEYQEIASQYGVSEAEARNIVARDYAVRAKAVLTAARADDVKIDSYTVGILNGLERGQYERTVYGKKTESGERRFARGRFFSELGFAEGQRARREGRGFVGTEAAKEQARRDFFENTGANQRGFGDNSNRSTAGRTGFTSDAPPPPKRENRFASFRRTEPATQDDSRFDFDTATERRRIEAEIPF